MIRKKILFIYPYFSTFVKKDLDSLKKRAEVLPYHYKPEKQFFKFLFRFLSLHYFILINIRKTDILFSWFSDYHSFPVVLLGRLFNKETVIIVGGNDAVSIPEIKYGIFYKKGFRQWCVRYSFKMANLILPVHKSLIKGVNYYADKAGIGTGVKFYVKNTNAEITEVPTGYDSEVWKKELGQEKEQSVVTTAGVKNMRSFILKGLPLFIEVARAMSEVKFIIVGVSVDLQESLKIDIPDNLIIHDYIENKHLAKYISKSKVYCQFSLSEGLPNALCEAMLCECIPVGSDVNGIPDGIGKSGFILEKPDISQAVGLVRKALNSDDSLGLKARNHIINQYSNERREKSLFKLLNIN